ncbi:MAG: hypothetical protein KDA24_21105, partial [Deltaproteobacteria bacterium]|nr:hypothetical protein [Deltaproteobacteria bacterium]
MTRPMLLAAALLLCACGGGESADPTPAQSPTPDPTPAPAAEETPVPPKAELPPAPIARVEPHELKAPHGHVRVDDYYWMKDRESEEVLTYLGAENAYTSAAMAHTSALQETLFTEITGRIKQDDASVPYELDGYWYARRYVEGGEYPLYVRQKGGADGPEQVLVDGNARAKGHDYFAAREPKVSSDDAVAAWGEDHVGRRIYSIYFKDLATDTMRDETIQE